MENDFFSRMSNTVSNVEHMVEYFYYMVCFVGSKANAINDDFHHCSAILYNIKRFRSAFSTILQ